MSEVYLVVGVADEDIRQEITEKAFVTKYNEDTGEPYQKEIVTTKHRVGNRTLTDKEWQTLKRSDWMLHQEEKEYAEEKVKHLIKYPFFYTSSGVGFPVWGVDLINTGEDPCGAYEVNMDLAELLKKQVADHLLASFGISNVPVKIFLVIP